MTVAGSPATRIAATESAAGHAIPNVVRRIPDTIALLAEVHTSLTRRGPVQPDANSRWFSSIVRRSWCSMAASHRATLRRREATVLEHEVVDRRLAISRELGNSTSGVREREVGSVPLMMTSHRSVLISTLALVASAAACADDELTLSATEFKSQANEICTVGGEEVHEAFFGIFGEDEPTPEQMEEALSTVMSVSRRQLDDIEALAEPSELSVEVDALLAQGRADTDAAEAMGLGFFENESDPWEQTGELARELGLDACAGG